ncbi:Phasin protein [Azospirillum oryzae]|uniref:Phasin protein n=1 Tax=Azospirillum oryzae TaxID=286727 RepID=A0A1X7GBK2_9PROT|nr:phasin family protein [Azospirillum oryzae]SMF67089.1 Phasin protein [Azospirillum oryzae]
MTAQPTPANVLTLFKTNAQTTAAKSARVATLVQDGYRRWFDGVTASVNDASRLAAGLGKARTPADLAALQRDWLSTTQARVTESVQGFLDVSSKIAAEITTLPAPAADAAPVAAPVAAPAPKVEAPKPVAVAAPKVEAPKVEAPKVEAKTEAPAPVPAQAAETAPVAATAAAKPAEVPVKELVETVKAEQAAPAAAVAAEVKAAAKPAPRRAAKPVAAKPASKTSPTVN